jgi:hypothetical protein
MAVLGAAGPVAANPLVVGLGFEGDDAGSRAYSMFVDIGLTDDTWLTGSVARTDTDRQFFDIKTKLANVAIDHHFKPFGVRMQAAYWGDKNLLESTDFGSSLYVRGERGSLSVDYLRRDFKLTVDNPLLADPITVDFDATGLGLAGSLRVSNDVRLYASGMDYRYSRNIRLQPDVDVATLRLFSVSRLSIVNSLLDYRASIGVERSFGLRSLDFRYVRWRTEVDRGDISSYGVGFLTPTGGAADMEFRLAYDDSENFGGAFVLSVFLYLFDE